MILASVDWEPFAILAGLLATVIPSVLLYKRQGQDAATKAEVDKAINSTTMVEQSFAGLKAQADAATAGHKRCEDRCDELAGDLRSTRAELAETLRKLETEINTNRLAERKIEGLQTKVASLERQIETMRESRP